MVFPWILKTSNLAAAHHENRPLTARLRMAGKLGATALGRCLRGLGRLRLDAAAGGGAGGRLHVGAGVRRGQTFRGRTGHACQVGPQSYSSSSLATAGAAAQSFARASPPAPASRGRSFASGSTWVSAAQSEEGDGAMGAEAAAASGVGDGKMVKTLYPKALHPTPCSLLPDLYTLVCILPYP